MARVHAEIDLDEIDDGDLMDELASRGLYDRSVQLSKGSQIQFKSILERLRTGLYRNEDLTEPVRDLLKNEGYVA